MQGRRESEGNLLVCVHMCACTLKRGGKGEGEGEKEGEREREGEIAAELDDDDGTFDMLFLQLLNRASQTTCCISVRHSSGSCCPYQRV